MSLPKKLGGGEFTPELLSHCERLAKADASVGWCFGQGTGCAMSAALEDEIARNIFGRRFSFSRGEQEKQLLVTAGIKFQVRRFASGGHATWLGGRSMVFEQDGSPEINKEGKHVDRTALFRKRQPR